MISDEYAAGFFDGEGCVTACIRRASGIKHRPSPTILVCISNTNKYILELHQKRWGGALYERLGKLSEKVLTGRWQRQYQWTLSSRKAIPFLRAIHQHVIVKKDVVDAALRYTELMATPHAERIDYSGTVERGGRLWVAPITRPEFRDKVRLIHDEIKALNKKSAPFNVLRGSGSQVTI